MMGLDSMTATNSRKNKQVSRIVVTRALIVFSTSVLILAFDVGSTEAQATRNSHYVGPPNIIVDLSVLDKFGPAPTLAGVLRKGSANLMPASAARAPGQLLAPPTSILRSHLTLPRGATTRRLTAPPPKPQVSVAAPNVKAIVATKLIAVPVPAVTSLLPSIPKPVDIVTAPKTAIPLTPKLTMRVPAPPKATSAVPQAPSIPKIPSTEPTSATVKSSGSIVTMLTTPVDVTEDGNKIRILFSEESSNLPDAAASELQKLAEKLIDNRKLRLVLYGFASGTTDTPSKARRLSLFRALAVRTQLMNYGVRSTRMQLRALGSRVKEGHPNRVDIVVEN